MWTVYKRIEQKIPVGMFEFYNNFDPDPLDRAFEIFRDSLEVSDEKSLRLAASIFENRVDRLIKIYCELSAMQENKPKAGFMDHYLSNCILGDRASVLCDHCKSSVLERKQMKLFERYRRDELGETIREIASVCDVCDYQPKGGSLGVMDRKRVGSA